MRQKLFLTLLALLTLSGSRAWATDVLIANCPNFTANTASSILPSTYGSFSDQTFTTNASSGMAGVTITAATGCTIGVQYVNVDNYGDCLKLVTSAASTDYQITLSAPTGYVITGYTLGGSANSNDYKHTLTSKDGSVSVVVTSPPYNSPKGAKEFDVSGLKEQTTYFTINTATAGNTLYIPTFTIYVYPEDQVRDVTYQVYYDGTLKTTATAPNSIVGSTLSLPSSAAKLSCTYTYYSDASMETEITTVPATGTVYAKAICNCPFTISSSYADATWYYLTLNNTYHPTYASGSTPNVTLPTSYAYSDENAMWAFMGNPYDGITIINKAAGSSAKLVSEDPSSAGASTYATLTSSGTYDVWFPKSSTSYTNGFYLFISSGYALNKLSYTTGLAFWTGGYDAGSTFTVSEVDLAAIKSAYLSMYDIAAENLDKPGFPTTAGKTAFTAAINAISSVNSFDTEAAAALATYKASVVYPSGTYYIKNRNTGCYAFITDDGELVPRIKIDNTVSHANNNYLWTVTSDKSAGTCSIVSSLYSNVHFAKGANNYSQITSSNCTTITTLSTELFSSNNGTSGAFYLGGAHNNNDYKGNGEGTGNSHVVNWSYQNSPGSQWIFEPVDLSGSTAYTVTVEGLEDGGQDAVTLSDGTIVNLGTGTAYLSETPTTSNVTQSAVSGYSIQDGSIVIDTENHTITVTYSPSYEVLVANYYDSAKQTNVQKAGTLGYPKTTTTTYTTLMSLLGTFTSGHEYTATDYANIQSYYAAYLAETDVVTPTSNTFWRIQSILGANAYLTAANASTRMTFTTTEDKTTIFLYDGSQLIAYANGLSVNNIREMGAVGASGNSFTFVKSLNGDLGKLSISATFNGGTNYIYSTGVNNSEADRNTLSSSWYNNNTFTLVPVTTLPVTITSAGYATLYSPVALTIPTGVKAYVISSLTTTEATLSEVATTIPAETPVILQAEAGTYNFTITTSEAFSGTNKLAGSVAAFTVSAEDVTNYYTLQQNVAGDAVGLFPKTAAGSIAGFKAYLPASEFPSGSEVKGFTFTFDDDATSIDHSTPATRHSGDAIYDLGGRKINVDFVERKLQSSMVNGGLQKGIYIVHGKKILK